MPWKTMISEYKALSLADKAGFWGSIASVVGLVLTIFGTHSIIPFAFGPLGFLLALAISGLIGFYAHWLSRAGFVRQALPQIPKHERGRVIRQHLGSTLPAELSPSEWLRDRRMLFRFWIYTGLILTVLLIATMLIWAFVEKAKISAQVHAIDEQRERIQQIEQRERAALSAVATAHGQVEVLARFVPSKELEESAKVLRRLVQSLEDRVQPSALSVQERNSVVLAKATVALIESKYSDVLELANDAVVDALELDAARATLRAFNVHEMRAFAFAGLRRWKEAEAEAEKCLKLAPENPGPRLLLAACLAGQGQLSKAIDEYSRLITDATSDVNRASVLNDLGNARYAAVPRDLDGSIQLFSKAIALIRQISTPSDFERRSLGISLMNRSIAREEAGSVVAAQRDIDEAVMIFRELTRKDESYAEDLALALKNRATKFHSFDDFEEALPIIERLVQEGNDGLLIELAGFYMNMGEYCRIGKEDFDGAISFQNKAIKVAQQLIHRDAGNHVARHLLGGAITESCALNAPG